MIYCVEDDAGIRNMMVYTLNASGYKAVGFEDGKAFFKALENNKVPQLVLLDIMLPDENGIEILKRIRGTALTADIPVIMATAKGTEYDKVVGLDLGADDYLSKPFGMMEMVSRVKAVLRRTTPRADSEEIRVGDLVLNQAEHTVTARGERVNLTLKEYELLGTFMENLGLVFTRDQLLTAIWGIDYDGETRTVDVHIRTLRNKLGECGGYIDTVRGVGYRMEGRV
ncbi:MAG: response regulator transcription factor [Clostridiales bacterium]|nr:response regulator transcription factor [Clostridiales bacterium]